MTYRKTMMTLEAVLFKLDPFFGGYYQVPLAVTFEFPLSGLDIEESL